MRRLQLGALLLLAVAGCKEQLAIPSECPGLCPGGILSLRDTILDPIAGSDSSFVGYVGRGDALGLMATSGTGVGDAYGVLTFHALPDSVSIFNTNHAYTIDSVAIAVGILGRDTALNDTRLLLYRLPGLTDSTATFAGIEALLTEDRLIDTLVIADSVISGQVSVMLTGEMLERIALEPGDNGQLAIGIRLLTTSPSGIRLGSRLLSGFSPILYSYVTAEDAVEAEAKRTIETTTLYSGYVRSTLPVVDPDLLVVGGMPASRTILRFVLPEHIRLEGQLVRATLELTPATPLHGLAFDPTYLEGRQVIADLGARSPPAGAGAVRGELPVAGSDVVRLEVGALVGVWFGNPNAPRLLYLSVAPEGFAFTEPVFFSTRSAAGHPRLRITYALPGRPEAP